MAAKYGLVVLKTKVPLHRGIFNLSEKCFHTTTPCEEVCSGRIKRTFKRNKPVTYEMSLPPHHIGQRKSWNTWNTTTVNGGLRSAETALDDVFIRKFIEGTFPELILSEIIIKRQHNIIRIAFLASGKMRKEKYCFLIGYTEELLTYWLHCIVKLELQILNNPKDVIFTYF